MAAAAAIGTLTKKIVRQCQPNTLASVSTAPSSGPARPPMGKVMPKNPIALPCSAAGNSERMKDSTWGTISPANTPWSTRAVSSTAMSGASPARSELAPNPAVPSTNSARWP